MGVTIHFEGRLKSKEAFDQLISFASNVAAVEGWHLSEIPLTKRELLRVKDEVDWDYTGFTQGIELQPHPNTDPLRLEFDEELYIQQYIKTQFAGPDVHIKVVTFLKDIQPFFNGFRVEDEGEFWESCDKELLNDHMDKCNRAIDDILKENPKACGPHRLPSGRIIDCSLGK